MKKIWIIPAIWLTLILSSCVPKDRVVYIDTERNTLTIEKESSYPVHIDDFCNMQKVIAESVEKIYVDRNTDVLYYIQTGSNFYGITPIIESDGTPLTYAEWKVQRNIQ